MNPIANMHKKLYVLKLWSDLQPEPNFGFLVEGRHMSKKVIYDVQKTIESL